MRCRRESSALPGTEQVNLFDGNTVAGSVQLVVAHAAMMVVAWCVQRHTHAMDLGRAGTGRGHGRERRPDHARSLD